MARVAAGFALAELLAGLTIGAFVARGRAEAAIFLAFRPWLLVALAAATARWPPTRRTAGYLAALLAASAGEALLVAVLGNPGWAAEAARAVLAGGLLAIAIDLVFAAAARAEPRFARGLGIVLCLGLLLAPGPLRLFERVALPPPPSVAGPRPAVMLLTGLPLLWREDRPGAATNHAVYLLAAQFRLRPIDRATPATLSAPVLLAAQPRELSAGEIEAIDRWVRMGGRLLALVDPDLRWASALPPGDPRRPPRGATLAPLLARWDIIVGRARERIETIDLPGADGVRRRIVADGAGTIGAAPGCRPLGQGRAADCRIGRGRALILADADMLDDALWVGPGANGAGRLTRGGDNGPLLAAWIDDLSGNRRDRRGESVAWRRAGPLGWPLLIAFGPALLLAGLSRVARPKKIVR